MLLNLFELEERNHTLKNILVIGVPEWKIFLSKLAAVFNNGKGISDAICCQNRQMHLKAMKHGQLP